MSVIKLMAEFRFVLESIYAVYLDGISGFMHLKQFVENQQQAIVAEIGISQEELDTRRLSYGNDPTATNAKTLLSNTQKQFKERNSLGGNNEVFLGNICLSQIYNYWENHYRGYLASELGLVKNDIRSELFGDLGKIRNDIIHHNGFATKPNSVRCKILKEFNIGEKISFTRDEIEYIIYAIVEEIKMYGTQHQ